MQQLLAALRNGSSFTLVSHVNPDGDAVGSLLGLGQLLEQAGKQVQLVLHNGVPTVFSFLPNSREVSQVPSEPHDSDYAILLDASDCYRSGYTDILKEYARRGALLVIDHHPASEALAQSRAHLHRISASSTCELVYQLALAAGYRITPAIATCLLTGIFTDTGGFQHSNTTNQVLEIAADLMQRGGKLHAIAQQVSMGKSLANLRLLGYALERLRIVHRGTVAVSVLTRADVEAVQASPDDVSGIISHLTMLPGVEVALLLSEYEDGVIRGSVRAAGSGRVDVRRFAALLGGGGHVKASGFSLAGHIAVSGFAWSILAPDGESR